MTKYQKNKLILLTLVSLAFLSIFWNYSQNGRYTMIPDNFLMVLDTKTGTIYFPLNKTYIKIDGEEYKIDGEEYKKE